MRTRSGAGTALVVGFLALSLASASCSATRRHASSGSTPTSSGANSTSSGANTAGSGVTKWPGTPVPETAIPLGDGGLSSSPEVGHEDTCTSGFRGGGARSSAPWIDTSTGTWNSKAKPAVQGANRWPGATHRFTLQDNARILVTDDLPDPGTTGDFPVSPSDPAYQYDRNPNSVQTQSLSWTVPATPQAAATPSCTGLGPIGVAVNGVAVFNALDDAGRDAGAHEVQDGCAGHPQAMGVYHYHDYSACLRTTANSAAGSSTLVGYAIDGYGIFVERDAQGNLPTDADLDVCHGRTSTVTWDGRPTAMYHYDVTLEYPYLLGCFHGTPASNGARP